MWMAHLICSKPDCTEELEVVVSDLAELEQLHCECDYGLMLLSISEVELVGP
jgi:hypothetical protein